MFHVTVLGLAFLNRAAESGPHFHQNQIQKYGSKSELFIFKFFKQKFDNSLLCEQKEPLFHLYGDLTLEYRRLFTLISVIWRNLMLLLPVFRHAISRFLKFWHRSRFYQVCLTCWYFSNFRRDGLFKATSLPVHFNFSFNLTKWKIFNWNGSRIAN